MQAGVVGNLDTNRTQMSALVTSSQGATGALQATQAGNQLLALQAQQLADLTAAVAAQGGRRTLRRRSAPQRRTRAGSSSAVFLTPGTAINPTTCRCFIDERVQQIQSTVDGRRRRGDGSGRRSLRDPAPW